MKCQSQYKIYEWMALLHWYILPIGIELGFNSALLQNFLDFVEIIEISMTIQGRTTEELANLHNLIKKFLEGFEKLYIGKDPAKVSRFRLCLFQLIHIPTHIEWYGSVRIGSQATVERAIGEMGHKVHSRKAPFANLANIIYERERAKLLRLYYPSLELRPSQSSTQSWPELFTKIPILKREYNLSQDFYSHLSMICQWLGQDFDPDIKITHLGKSRLPGQDSDILHSKLGEARDCPEKKSQCYFEAWTDISAQPTFGEALAFYEVGEMRQSLVVFCPIINQTQVLKAWRGNWSHDIQVLPVSALHSLIGVFNGHCGRIYIQ